MVHPFGSGLEFRRLGLRLSSARNAGSVKYMTRIFITIISWAACLVRKSTPRVSLKGRRG